MTIRKLLLLLLLFAPNSYADKIYYSLDELVNHFPESVGAKLESIRPTHKKFVGYNYVTKENISLVIRNKYDSSIVVHLSGYRAYDEEYRHISSHGRILTKSKDNKWRVTHAQMMSLLKCFSDNSKLQKACGNAPCKIKTCKLNYGELYTSN